MQLANSPLRFHRLSFLEDRGEVIVGRTDIGSFGLFPSDGAALVRELAAGRPPEHAADWYAQTFGGTVDIAHFIGQLRDLQLLREDDAPDQVAAPAPVRWQRLGAALFSAPVFALYAGLLLVGATVCVADPRMLPRPSNMFFSDYLLLVSVSVVVGQAMLAVVHEASHVLAGRRLGVNSTVRLAWRFYFVVLETNLDGLAVVPRRKRILPLLAGLGCDLLAVAVLTIVAYLTRGHGPEVSPVSAFCLAMAVTTIPRMVWQFYLFLRTDIYYLITTLTGCVDLDRTARDMLANRLNALIGRTARLRDDSGWHPRDRRAARWYIPLMVGGYAAMVGMLVLTVPVGWTVLSTAAHRIFSDAPSTAHLLDSAVVLAFIVGQPVVAIVVALRKRRADARSTTHVR